MNAAVFVLASLVADPGLGAAPANPTPVTAAAPTAETVGWYGAPAVITDGVAIPLFVAGLGLSAETEQGAGLKVLETLTVGGFFAYPLGGPIVHLSNRHYGRAAASFGVRAAAMIGSGVIALAHVIHSCNDDYHPPACGAYSAPLLVGIALPLVAAAALDDLLLARGTIAPPRPKASPASPIITPRFGPDWAALSIGGVF